jgi:glycine cleavage system P protein (glycine dehydrogenase) subunit 1
MLGTIGAASLDTLFEGIPEDLRLGRPLDLPSPMSEPELLAFFSEAAASNRSGENAFLGAGVYPHYIPTAVDALVSRSEFYTAYTPYQPEIAQGTLQAIFEFQTYMTQLTGLEVANASLYDGSTALAEAILMAHRITGRPRYLLARTIHPEYRAVAETYTRRLGVTLELVEPGPDGRIGADAVEARMGPDVGGVVVQSPNFFGSIESPESLAAVAHAGGALSVVVVAEATSLGILRPPGVSNDEAGRADIVVGEAQSLGIPMSFGGPHLGFLTTHPRHLRQMPGRLVGMGHDRDGRRAFVLTLSTREQHIRREKATSNICTNQSLCALMATIYLALLGPAGFREVALRNLSAGQYLNDRVRTQTASEVLFPGPRFNELVVRPSKAAGARLRRLREAGNARGLELGRFFPELDGALLLAVTEVHSREAIDALVGELA